MRSKNTLNVDQVKSILGWHWRIQRFAEDTSINAVRSKRFAEDTCKRIMHHPLASAALGMVGRYRPSNNMTINHSTTADATIITHHHNN